MVKKSGGALLLSVTLDPAEAKPLSTQLCLALRELILSGGLRAGDRLPATRVIAKDLKVSRTTVIEAFMRLQAEGLIDSRTGAGTYVSRALEEHRPRASEAGSNGGAAKRQPRLSRSMTHGAPIILDRLTHEARAFTTAMPAFDAFPMGLWSRHVAKHWRARRDVILGYGDTQGFMPLRRAIAAHLRANRAIACEPEEVFVTNGAQHAFQLIASILVDPGERIWFENPGAIGARNCFAASGAELIPVPVDKEGLMVEAGLAQAPHFRLAFVTPAHQQPLGSTMSLRRRLALLTAAEAADAWIVEDDYDGEFCYAGMPPPTLKSTDTADRVIYVGTFSKTLFPALRLGYVLVPKGLVAAFDKLIKSFVTGVPSNQQAVVADFMDEGHFASHIRRMRKLYAERHDALLDAADGKLEGLLDVMATDTGLHTVGFLRQGKNETEISAAAQARNITAVPFGRFSIEPIQQSGLVLGFSGVSPAEIRKGVDVLAEVIAGAEPRGPQ